MVHVRASYKLKIPLVALYHRLAEKLADTVPLGAVLLHTLEKLHIFFLCKVQLSLFDILWLLLWLLTLHLVVISRYFLLH